MRMGPSFLSSGLYTLLSFHTLVLLLGRSREKRTLHGLPRAQPVTLLVEAGLIAASLARMSRWSKPLFSKTVAPLFVGGTLLGGIAAPLALLSGRETRNRRILTSVLVLLGGLAFRFAMVRAGRISADDPQSYFTFTRGENAPQPEDKI